MPGQPVGFEVFANAEWKMEKCDYGVPRSTVWHEIDQGSFDFTDIEIGGKEYSNWDALVADVGVDVAEWIAEMFREEVMKDA